MYVTYEELKFIQLKLGHLEVSSNIAPNHSPVFQEVISGHCVPNSHQRLSKSEIISS